MAYSGQIFQLNDIQRMNSVDMLNVYFYKNDAGDGDAGDLAASWRADVLPAVAAIQSADMSHLGLSVISLFDDADFFTDGTVVPGDVGTESFPNTDAVNFTLRATSRAVRPGSKRIAGIPEDAGNHNLINDAGYITDLNDTVLALGAVLTADVGTGEYEPCIVKRIPYTTPGGNPAYRLPAVGSEAVVFGLGGVVVSLYMSHQVSRSR